MEGSFDEMQQQYVYALPSLTMNSCHTPLIKLQAALMRCISNMCMHNRGQINTLGQVRCAFF
jgi:hypothetical protein